MVSKPAARTRPAVDFELGVVEHALLVADVHQLAEEVVAGFVVQARDVAVEPVVEGPQSVVHLPELPPRQAEVKARGGGGAEGEHPLAVGLGDSEDLGDDGDRQLRAVAVDQVDRPVLGAEVVEQLGSDRLGALAELLDRLDGEDPGHQLAVAGVLGRLDHQERGRRDGVHGAGGGAEREPTERVVAVHRVARAEVPAGEHLLDEVVTRRDVAELASVDGTGRPQVLDGVPHVATGVAGVDQAGLQVAAPGGGTDEDGEEAVRHAPVRTPS